MKRIQNQMNLDEHCTECGVMLVDVVVALVCPHCGYEIQPLEDLPVAVIASLTRCETTGILGQTQQAA